jgi:hypothetical protein
MSINKHDSQLADRSGNPLIGAKQNAPTSTGLANNADVATLVATKAELDGVIAILKAHGLCA